MTVSADEHYVGSLCGRLARGLKCDRTVRLAWLHGSAGQLRKRAK